MTSVSFFSTLRSRVLGLAVMAALPPLAVMVSLAAQWRHHEVLDAQASALELVHHAAALHERELEGCGRMLTALEPLAVSLPDRSAEVTALLTAALRSESPHENLGVFTADGQLLASVRPSSGVAARPFFERAVRTRQLAVDDYAIDLETGTAAVAVAYPVVGTSGQTQRVIFRVLEVGWLRDFASKTRLLDGTIVTLFDDSGTIVAQHDSVGVRSAQAMRNNGLIQTALQANTEGTMEAPGDDGVLRTFAFAPLKDGDTARRLFVSVGFPTAAATAQADRILKINLVGFTGATLFVMVVAWTAGDRLVVRHVQALVAAAGRLGRGDMSARVGTSGRPAELAELARTVDEMAEALQAREREVVRQHDRWAIQERRFRSLIENSSEGISLRDSSGRLLYVSPSSARILGYAPEEVLGRDSLEFVHPHDRDHLKALLAHALARPGALISGSFRLRHKNGTWRWIASDMQNLLHEPEVSGIIGNYRDITDYRETQEALRKARNELEQRVRQRTAELIKANETLRSEIAERKRVQETLQKLSHVIEQTADSVLVTDRSGTIEYVNPSFEAMTGYSRAEAVGQNPRLFSSGVHDARFYETLWTTILSGRVFRAIVTNRTKDGRLFDEDQTITPIRDEAGVITHFVSTGRDITERKRTEQAVRRLNQLLEQETTRIANVLHDEAGQFLTSAHIMLADLARDLPARARDRIQEVRQHLDQVEQQLRTISRDLHPRILSDLGLVGTIRFRADAFARRTGIRTSVQTAADYGPAPAVQAAIYRLVQEGLTNIARHAHASTVTVTLTDDGQQICCSVRDDGVGFDFEQVCRRRGESSLGLQGMKDRVEALGGSLDITSAPNRGTELRARLPLVV